MSTKNGMKCDVSFFLCLVLFLPTRAVLIQLCAHTVLLTVLYLHSALAAPCYSCAVPARLSDTGAQLSQAWAAHAE